MTKPLWLLDVDGVINALAKSSTLRLLNSGWENWTQKTVMGYPITYVEDLIKFINIAHNSGKVDIQWLTTWEDNDAVYNFLTPELGLEHFEIAGRQSEHLSNKFSDYSHWWKLKVVEELSVDHKKIIWTDDDINQFSQAVNFVNNSPHVHAIIPDPRIGLTRNQTKEIERLINE